MVLRVGVVGLGFAGARLHVPALRRIKDVELAGTVDPDPARGATFADLDSLLDRGVDAVVIATPVATHFDLAIKALDAGCHVYLEKPMTDSVASAESLVAAVPPGRTVQVGFAYRFHPLWQRVFQLVDRGAIPGPWRAEGRFECADGVGWEHPAINVGCHHVDLLTRMAGRSPTDVSLSGAELRAWWPDGSELVGRYGPGVGTDRMTLTSGSRRITLDRVAGLRLRGAGWRAAVPHPALVRAWPARTGWERSFERALASFAAAAREGRPGDPGFDAGLDAVRVSAAALASITG